jgi:hypothetical protein
MNTLRLLVITSILALGSGFLTLSVASAANCWKSTGTEPCFERCGVPQGTDCTKHCSHPIPGLCAHNKSPTGQCAGSQMCYVLTGSLLKEYQCSPC